MLNFGKRLANTGATKFKLDKAAFLFQNSLKKGLLLSKNELDSLYDKTEEFKK